jgi:hypothetical protein
VGDESFAALARAFWHHAPPADGDMALWGEGLAAFVEAAEQLAEEPYLADVARVEWALHRAAFAADAPAHPVGLGRLATDDPAQLRLVLSPGAALCVSPHPVVSVWRAHQPGPARTDDERFAEVRLAFAQQRGECAFIVRQGFKPVLHAVAAAEAGFIAAVLQGHDLAAALSHAGAGFDFSAWLVNALREAWIAAVEPTTA